VQAAEAWLKYRAEREKEIPQWRDIYQKLPQSVSDEQYDSLRDAFFHEVLWPELLKRKLVNDTHYVQVKQAFMDETERSR
jgi:hypothetical protein